MVRLEPAEFIKKSFGVPVVDVRSPGEYARGHFNGALNLPLFDDEERAIVGTLYKKRGQAPAIEKGLEIAGPKLADLSKAAGDSAKRGELLVYCWRGGMRSEKMAWLFELAGLKCSVLIDGYKGYRRLVLDSFNHISDMIVVGGKTGSGKTDILLALEAAGEQILNLEKVANHKGSTFGSLGMGEQPTTQQFQNDLHHELLKLDNSKRIWVEGESRNIGRVTLPETLWDVLNHAKILLVDVERKHRVGRILKEYGPFPTADLSEALSKIEPRLGSQNYQKALAFLEKREIAPTIEMLLDYYDKSYLHSLNKHKKNDPIDVVLPGDDPVKHAQILINTINSQGKIS